MDEHERRELAAARCALCAAHVPHHTNSRTSIGGADRVPIYDLHAMDDPGGVGLAECTAAEVWRAP